MLLLFAVLGLITVCTLHILAHGPTWLKVTVVSLIFAGMAYAFGAITRAGE
jgi:hypothetical protein